MSDEIRTQKVIMNNGNTYEMILLGDHDDPPEDNSYWEILDVRQGQFILNPYNVSEIGFGRSLSSQDCSPSVRRILAEKYGVQ